MKFSLGCNLTRRKVRWESVFVGIVGASYFVAYSNSSSYCSVECKLPVSSYNERKKGAKDGKELWNCETFVIVGENLGGAWWEWDIRSRICARDYSYFHEKKNLQSSLTKFRNRVRRSDIPKEHQDKLVQKKISKQKEISQQCDLSFSMGRAETAVSASPWDNRDWIFIAVDKIASYFRQGNNCNLKIRKTRFRQ